MIGSIKAIEKKNAIEVSQEEKGGNVSDGPDEAIIDQNTQAGQGFIGSQPDDDVQYVKGHPVIQSGNYLTASHFTLVTTNTPCQASMYPTLLCLPATMEILH